MNDLLIKTSLKFTGKARKLRVVKNTSGGALVEGDVVVIDHANCTSALIAVTTTTSQDSKDVYGMLYEDIANGGFGRCLMGGLTAMLKVDGTADIAVGSLLSTFTSAGIAALATAGKGGVFAMALEAYATNDSLGVIDALLFDAVSRVDTAGTVDYAEVGDMAANGTSTANAAGVSDEVSRGDHVHKIGTHDHSDATKGSAIVLAALGAGIFTADATGRAKFATDFLDATKLADIIAIDAMTNAFCDAAFAASAFAADVDSRAIFADGIWTNAKMAAGFLSADATGRALMATNLFDSATVAAKFEDSSIPSSKVNWSYGVAGLVHTIVPDDSAAAGTALYVARVDHAHAIVCGPPVDGSLAAANAEGSGTSFSRNDHAHKAIVIDDVPIILGTGSDIQILLSSANLHASSTNKDLVIALSDNDQALHITDIGAKATNWNLADATHPTVYVHSNTTPATDYLAMYHDGTTGYIGSLGGTLDLTAVGEVTVNEASADVNFRVETNGLAYAIYSDGAKDSIVLGSNTDVSSADQLVTVSRAARTATAATSYADLWVSPTGAVTTAGGATTHAVIASAYFAEPNITNAGGDTVTVAATVYIKDAPTEGAVNHALYVATGTAAFLGAVTCASTLTASAGIIVDTAADPVTVKLMGAADGYNNDITDLNANEIISLQGVTTAVNELTITNSIATASVDIGVSGSDANITLGFIAKGTGQFDFAAGTPGTAAAPEIILQGDLDSGLYQPAANKVGIAVSGALVQAWASGNMLLNSDTPAANTGAGVFIMGNAGTAPTGSQANGIVLYAYDVTASSELRVRDEAGNDAVLSPHNENGDYVINSYCAKKGTTFRVNLEKLIKKLAEKFPDDFKDMVEAVPGFAKGHIK